MPSASRMLSLWVYELRPEVISRTACSFNLGKKICIFWGPGPDRLWETGENSQTTSPLFCLLVTECPGTLKYRIYSGSLVRSRRKIPFDICTCQGTSWVPGRLNSAQRKQSVQRVLLEEKVTALTEIKYKTGEQLRGQRGTCLISEELRITCLQEGPMGHLPRRPNCKVPTPLWNSEDLPLRQPVILPRKLTTVPRTFLWYISIHHRHTGLITPPHPPHGWPSGHKGSG